jgi:hypothetical protein
MDIHEDVFPDPLRTRSGELQNPESRIIESRTLYFEIVIVIMYYRKVGEH